MKLATFQANQGTARVGLVVDGGVIDLARHLQNIPNDMTTLIEAWSEFKPLVESLAKNQKADFELSAVNLLAPIQRPGKILCIGLNYADHVIESGMETPADQLWFAKMGTSVNAPYGDIQLPKVSSQLDYEAELVVVIGKRCRHVTREQAADVIFGYSVGDDVSVRDWQWRTSQFVIGKSFDTHAPYGPVIVTTDELADPHHLGIRCFVNGEKRQDSNTDQLIFDCFDQIVHLSKAMTLEPGDILFTGTPGGVGVGFKPFRFLVAGDVVRVEIDGIGAIENRVTSE